MDDLAPLPHIAEAAVVRSTEAHARIVAVDVSAALAVPGVVGVLTGEDVAALSRPFPSAIGRAVEHWAAAVERGPLRRRAGGGGRGLATATWPRTPPSWWRWSTTRCRWRRRSEAALAAGGAGAPRGGGRQRGVRPAVLLRRRRRRPWPAPTSWCGAGSAIPGRRAHRSRGCGVICCLGRRRRVGHRLVELPGPFTLHGVAAAALGLPAGKLRLVSPPDSGGSFGVKAGVFTSVVLMALASRRFGVPGAVDGGPRRAPPVVIGHRAAVDGGSRLHRRRRARGAAARPGRRRRRLRPGPRAGHALPDARLHHRALPGGRRRGPQPGRRDQPLPHRPEPGLRRPPAVLRPGADDGHRRRPPRPRPGRGPAPQPGARLGHALPRPGRRGLRLRRLPRLPRPRRSTWPATTGFGGAGGSRDVPRSAATYAANRGTSPDEAGSLRACSASASPVSWSRRPRTWATSPWSTRPNGERPTLPKDGNAETVSIAMDPGGGVSVGLHLDAPGPGPPDRGRRDRGRRPGRAARRT